MLAAILVRVIYVGNHDVARKFDVISICTKDWRKEEDLFLDSSGHWWVFDKKNAIFTQRNNSFIFKFEAGWLCGVQ
jgi:hypothetical protein